MLIRKAGSPEHVLLHNPTIALEIIKAPKANLKKFPTKINSLIDISFWSLATSHMYCKQL